MVTNQLISVEKTKGLSFRLIKHDKEEFIAAIIKWYINFKSVGFYEHDPLIEVPNLFFLFEYKSEGSDDVYQAFINDGVHSVMIEHPEKDLEDVKNEMIDSTQTAYPYIAPYMLLDVKLVLDAYHLFYCYRDDASAETQYYNPVVLEVW